MLHGNPTWSFYYRNLVLSLRGDYRVVVPDHIGCGLSDKPDADDVSLHPGAARPTTWKRCWNGSACARTSRWCCTTGAA